MKLNLKGPKVSRRKIGRAPRQDVVRQCMRIAIDSIRKHEDMLWMELACKELAISPSFLIEPTHSSVGLELKMKQDAAQRRLKNWVPKEITLPFKVLG